MTLDQMLRVKPPRHDHEVRYYEEDATLAEWIADFFKASLKDGDPALIVATPEHFDLFLAALSARGIDSGALIEEGTLVLADARSTLASFLDADGGIDRKLFERNIGGLIDRLTEIGPLRIFGEMVALLWNEGDRAAAIELEDAWNELAVGRPFTLLCAYPLSSFGQPGPGGTFQDIQDRHSVAMTDELQKMVDQTRLSSEARFRSLVQNSRDVIAVIDGSGACKYVSPAVESLSGFAPNDVIGTSGFEYIHPDDHSLVASHLELILAQPDLPVTVEVRTRTTSGQWIWIEIRAANRLDDPSIAGIVLNYHDITARKSAEHEKSFLLEKQKELAQQFRLLLDSTAEGIYGLDSDGACTFMNRAGAELLGGTPERFIGKMLHALTHHTRPDGSDFAVEDCRIYGAFKNGEGAAVADELFWRLDGSSFPVEYSAFPIDPFDGHARGAVVAFQDVSQRKEMEEDLRQSEELFRGAFDAGRTGIALIAADGREYVDVNNALCDMLGYTKEELLALDWLQITHPEDRERNLSVIEQFFAGRVDLSQISKRYVRKDGESIFVDIVDSLVRNDEGDPKYFVTHVMDVTERQEAAEEREKLQDRLRQAQKMEAVGQLAGGVAHDFNNILAVILNYAEFLSEDLDEHDPRIEDVRQIQKAGERAAEMVHQLLAFSRKEVIEPKVIDVNLVIEGLRVLLRRSIGEDISLAIKSGDGLPMTKADPGQLEQILLNLVVNARDAMPEGGSITISTGVRAVVEDDLPGLVPGTYVCLTVSDTGEGMHPEVMERIFEPFFTTKQRGEGTGLGLATTYGIANQAGGGVYVDSVLGTGSTFDIYLPTTDEGRASPPPAQRELEHASHQSKTVLVVEDESAVREVVSRILLNQGFTVVAKPSGAEALEYLSTGAHVDLLLTDVIMPGMSGRELSEAVYSTRPEMPTVFMSGYTDEIIAQRGVLEAGDHLMKKPFKAGELVSKIRSVLSETVSS